MDHSNNSNEKDSNRIVGWLWYEGDDAVKEGEGFCYNTDYGTATAKDGRRNNRVERPSLINSHAFAGVADQMSKIANRFQPPEKQFHLPTMAVERGYRFG